MALSQILSLFRKKIWVLLLGGALLASLSFLFLVLSQKNFRVDTDYLVVQTQNGNQDFYTLSKSAEYFGKILSEAAYSEKFIDEVFATGKVSDGILPRDKKERMEDWAKLVKVRRNLDLGIISVTVYSNNQGDALNLAEAVSDVLTQKNQLFHGAGDGLEIRVLSGPILEKNPSIKEIVIVLAAGLLVGMFSVFFWVYYKEAQRYASPLAIPAGQPYEMTSEEWEKYLEQNDYK